MNSKITGFSKPVALVGMMGSGKSNLGRLLAQRLGLAFFDSDHLVEQRAGCTIAEIFERYGEDKFRQSEALAIADTVQDGPCVLATDGGALLRPETLELLKKNTMMIWVEAGLEDILRRVSRNTNRPLLACENPAEVLQRLMAERRPLYEQAPIRIHNAEGKLEEACNAIIQALKEHSA